MEEDNLRQRLQRLRELYYLLAPMLVLVVGTSLRSSPRLAWTAGILLLLLTVNLLVPYLRRR